MKRGRESGFVRPLLVGGILAALAAVMLFDPGGQGGALWEWIERDRGPLAWLLFGAAYVVGTLLFVPSPALAIGAGALFGGVWGALLAIFCRPLGALLAFWVGRYAAREGFRRRVGRWRRFAEIDRKVAERPFAVVTTLRLVPVMPFNLLNYALGMTDLDWKRYTAATFLGVMPVTLIYVWIGDGLMDRLSGESGGGWLPWSGVLLISVLIAVGIHWGEGRGLLRIREKAL